MEWCWLLEVRQPPWNRVEWRRTCRPWGCIPQCKVPVATWPRRQVLRSTQLSSITRQPAVFSVFHHRRLRRRRPVIRTLIPWVWRLRWLRPQHVPKIAASRIWDWRPDDTRKHWDSTGLRKTKKLRLRSRLTAIVAVSLHGGEYGIVQRVSPYDSLGFEVYSKIISTIGNVFDLAEYFLPFTFWRGK